MRHILLLTALLTLAAAPALRAGDLPAPGADGFITMFNGTDLTGWEGLTDFWSVKNGAITGAESKEHPAPQTFLVYKTPFSDFELHYKFKFNAAKGNSGVQFRSKMAIPKQFRIIGYQADCDVPVHYAGIIYDEGGGAGGRKIMSNRGEKTHWTAADKRENTKLAESDADLQKVVKADDWNDCVLVANGNHITYSINGHLMTDVTDESPKAVKDGLIGLQLHQGFVMEVQFKDLRIKPLTGK